jgi:hypothetical protein
MPQSHCLQWCASKSPRFGRTAVAIGSRIATLPPSATWKAGIQAQQLASP